MRTRRHVGYALLVVALLSLVVWTVSQLIHPILPTHFNSGLILFCAALLGVLGILAQFKDVIELMHFFSRKPSPTEEPPPVGSIIDGPVQLLYGNVTNVTVNVNYIVQSSPFTVINVPAHLADSPSQRARPLVPREAPPVPESFTGRISEIAALRRILLQQSKATVLTSLIGLGGVGKTALAAAVANHPDIEQIFADGTLWASPEGLEDFRAMLAHWIGVLDPSAGVAEMSDMELLLHQFHLVVQNRRMLIVLDDVEKDIVLQVRSLVQAIGPECRVLVTSRAVSLPGVQTVVSLDVLPEREAISVLEKGIGRRFEPRGRIAAREIAFLLGYHPLALRLAVGMLNTGMSLTELRDRIRDRLEAAKSVELDELRKHSVQKTLEYACARLSTQERDRFRALSAFPPTEAFDVEAASSVWRVSSEEAEHSLTQFAHRGLLHSTDGLYRVHPLVYQYIEELLKSPGQDEPESD